MAVTSYYSVNGVLLGEKSTGGSRVDYLSDALGSVTATVNASAQVVNTYRYKPYGTQLAKTGVGTDPAFTWVGRRGYRQTNKNYSDVYVRMRTFSTILGVWLSLVPNDRLGISEHRYGISFDNPVTYTDSSGLFPLISNSCHNIIPDSVQDHMEKVIGRLCYAALNPYGSRIGREIIECLRSRGLLHLTTMGCINQWCTGGKEIECQECNRDREINCEGPCQSVVKVKAPPCAQNNCKNSNDPQADMSFCSWWWTDFPKHCPNNKFGDYCGRAGNLPGSPSIDVIHELIHMCGSCDDGPGHPDSYNYAARCIIAALGLRTD